MWSQVLSQGIISADQSNEETTMRISETCISPWLLCNHDEGNNFCLKKHACSNDDKYLQIISL